MEVGEVWPPQTGELAAFHGMLMMMIVIVVSSHYINSLGDVFLFRKSHYTFLSGTLSAQS